MADDASKDNNHEIVSGFSDKRISYIRHEVNKGKAGARNTGVMNSNCEYIAFLDDDDECLPEKLKIQVDLLENSLPNVVGVYRGLAAVDRTNGRILYRGIPTKRGSIFNEMLIQNWIGTPFTKPNLKAPICIGG